ncbi:MAG: anaerobic ribonucleoside-triphosphate reductase [Clostridium sp.]|uniref:anaerobic ribonucleoside-triphosphate reductase n=1 Tax=Clostridium sp. TaxID=1506 RepID=UPI003F37F7DB
MTKNIKIIKKDGTIEEFDEHKIINAITKSSERVLVVMSDDDKQIVCDNVIEYIIKNNMPEIQVQMLHNLVETQLDKVNSIVAKSYREYRNYKKDFIGMLDDVYQKAQKIMYLGDKDNSNTNSALVTTKRSLIYGELNKELYNKFFLTKEERQACRDGYLYIHDKTARRDTYNCCLYDTKRVMSGGFEMGNIWYNEPKSIDTACDVLGDIIMMSASSEYGGWSTRVDDLLAPYVEKSYNTYKDELLGYGLSNEVAEKQALKKANRDLEQGIQGLEIKLNSVASSRGDYPFTTFAFGLGVNQFEQMVSKALLNVRMNGQGKDGNKKPVLFPKLVFLYDEELHGEGKILENIFNLGVICSSKAMYPDWLSLSGEGYVPEMYKKYGEIVYPMGCRAFLSPYYERGGVFPADSEDKPVFTGRFNNGAITLNLIMIYQKAKVENKDFYEVLNHYLNMIRTLHKRTKDYLGEMKASTNPLAFCEGGLYGGYLKPNEKIGKILDSCTYSFGVTGLNELQRLHNGKSLVEDGEFALSTMTYLNSKINEFKNEDKILYAIYGTPAESLCGLQIEQFRKKYGIIPNVSDRSYTSNSFHCHVTEKITPIEKQDLEKRFWDLFNGGKIQYVRYPIGYNIKAIKTLIRRAMKLGFYEGVNLALSYCNDCGHQEENMDVCPVCGSYNLTKIDRMNGYLSYSRVDGDTRLNKSKMEEISERVSM